MQSTLDESLLDRATKAADGGAIAELQLSDAPVDGTGPPTSGSP